MLNQSYRENTIEILIRSKSFGCVDIRSLIWKLIYGFTNVVTSILDAVSNILVEILAVTTESDD